MTLRVAGIKEAFNVIWMRNPGGCLVWIVKIRAVPLGDVQAYIKAWTPAFVSSKITGQIAVTKFIVNPVRVSSVVSASIEFVLGTFVSLSVQVLKRGQVVNVVYRKAAVVRDGEAFSGSFPGFCGNQYNAIAGPHTIQGSRSALEYCNVLDIFGIDICQSRSIVHGVLHVVVVGNGYTIHNNHGLIAAQGRVTPYNNTAWGPNGTTSLGNLHTCHTPWQRRRKVQVPGFGDLLGFHILDSRPYRFSLTGNTKCRNNHFFQNVDITHLNVNNRTIVY